MIQNSCAFTGHRPSRFSFGYYEESPQCQALKIAMVERIWFLAERRGVTDFYSGMALGTDMWAAEIVLQMKATAPQIHLHAVLPCETQASRWAERHRDRYYGILAKADTATFVSRRYTPDCMYKRNRHLVDRAAYLLAVYDEGPKGGTAYTVAYARKLGRDICLIHPDDFS